VRGVARSGPDERHRGRSGALFVALALFGLLLVGRGGPEAKTTPPSSSAATAMFTAAAPTAPSAAPIATGASTTGRPPPRLALLGPGSAGPQVLALQQRLVALHYWLGVPDGVFGDSTEQAVYALQKAAGLSRDGIVGPKTQAALAAGVVARPRPSCGYLIEIDLQDDLLMFVRNGELDWTLNTSTGGGYTYCEEGACAVANTPTGHFRIFSEVDGLVVDPLGELWRPKYFAGGFALHGDSYVPPVPVSHGCVRVSDEAIDWIWSENLAPMGTAVWIF
jgi:hypothetical protein